MVDVGDSPGDSPVNARVLLLTVLATCVVVCSARLADAQARSRPSTRTPAVRRPTVSPWLNLYRRDGGPLGGYLSDVRPRQELYRTLQRQSASIDRERVAGARREAGIQALQRQVLDLQRRSEALPTGIGSVFMDYSHYYPALRTPVRRR